MFPDKFRIIYFAAYLNDIPALAKMGVNWLFGGPQPGGMTTTDYYAAAKAHGMQVTLGMNFTTQWTDQQAASHPSGLLGTWNNLSDANSIGTHGLDELPPNNYYCCWNPDNVPPLMAAYEAAIDAARQPFIQTIDAGICDAQDTRTANHPYCIADFRAVLSRAKLWAFDYYPVARNIPVTAAVGTWQDVIAKGMLYSNGAPWFMWTEIQAQGTTRAPTAQEVFFQMGLQTVLGARSVGLFGAALTAGADVQAAIAKFAMMVKANPAVFDAAPGPVTTTGTVYSSTRNGVTLAANNSTSPAQFMGVTLAPLDFQLIGATVSLPVTPAPTPAPAVQYATEAEMKALAARVATLEQKAAKDEAHIAALAGVTRTALR